MEILALFTSRYNILGSPISPCGKRCFLDWPEINRVTNFIKNGKKSYLKTYKLEETSVNECYVQGTSCEVEKVFSFPAFS